MNDSVVNIQAQGRETVTVVVHTGYASVENGAMFPMSLFKDLATACEAEVEYGNDYGSDGLIVGKSDWPVVEELLKETRLLYKVQGVHDSWINRAV